MSTGWIRGRFVGTYAGTLAHEQGEARRYSIELQSGTVHDARWAEPPADEGDASDGEAGYRRARLGHVRFAPPGEAERVGTLHDARVTIARLRDAQQLGARSFGRLEGTILARLQPEPAAAPSEDEAQHTAAAHAAEAPQPTAGQADPAPQPSAAPPPTAAVAPPAAEPASPAAPREPRVEPLRPFAQPIRRTAAIPLDPVPRGFHPAWLLVGLVLAWVGGSAWLNCGPQAAAIWAAPLLAGTLTRRSTLRLRLRAPEIAGWVGVALAACVPLLLIGPADQAWRSGCLPPLGVRLPLVGVSLGLAIVIARLLPITVATLLWTLAIFGWCDRADGTCGQDAARGASALAAPLTASAGARDERRWPKDPEQLARAPVREPTPKAKPSLAAPQPPAPPEPAPGAEGEADEGADSSTDASASAPEVEGEPPPAPEAAPAPAREPPDPATPISMEQANRRPGTFFGSRGRRTVVLPSEPVFGSKGAEVTGSGQIELSRLAALLKLQGDRRIRLELHTEPRGDADAEQALTTLQAHAVRAWLQRTGGVDTRKLEIVALGSRRPLATLSPDSDLPDDDRRIELRVLDGPEKGASVGPRP